MKKSLVTLFTLLALAGCTGGVAAPMTSVGSTPSAAVAESPIIAEAAWVRATTGATNASMTGAFMSLVNPGETEIRLVGASTPVAPMVQVHEMVDVDGAMVMREAAGGLAIPAGGHLHLKPGSYHVMLMMLTAPLAVGDQVRLTLRFSDGSQVEVNAPVKAFVEEEDHYHSPSPSLSPTAS